MQLIINLKKKYLLVLMLGILLAFGGFFVYAYGTNNPSVFGHSWGEIDGVPETATRWPSWNEISNKPLGLSDGIISWSEITNIPNVLSDGIVSGNEIDWSNVILPQNIKVQLKGDTGPAGPAGSSTSNFVSGGLYGYCSTNSLAGGCSAVSPASCHATYCECDTGYTKIYLSGEVGYPVYRIMCLKN